jgi:hypothetical protein
MPTKVKYRAEFDRIGRTHNVEPLEVELADGARVADQFAEAIDKYARRFLMSWEVEILVYSDGGGDIIVGGWRNGGTFTWTRTEVA